MEIDPQVEAFLRPFSSPDAMPEAQPLEEARANYRELFGGAAPQAPPLTRRALACPGLQRSIPCHLYQPDAASGSPRPLLIYLHGGGGVLGDVESYDRLMGWLSHQLGYPVLFVEYCLAPEFPFPQGVRECHSVLQWAASQAPAWGARADRIGLVGDSTGGSLCNACCLLARESGEARIAAQFLLYPVLDLRGDSDYPSRREFGDGRYFLGQDGIDWSRDNFLTTAAQQYDPLASPLAETELRNLPPTLIMTASHDPLRDEGQAYAVALQAAGVPTVYHCVDGAIHGFLSFAGKLATGRRGLVWLCEQIKTTLA